MKGWLKQYVDSRAYPFVVVTYVEKTGWASAKASDEMASLLAESTASQVFIERMSRRRGWSEAKTRSRYISERQPTVDAARKGKFGEVLHGAALEKFCGMVVICQRYRHAPAPDISPPGPDIMALMPQAGGGDRMVYVETKLRTAADGDALAKALDQLARLHDATGESKPLMAVLHALHDEDPVLFNRVVRATDANAPKPHYRIGAVFEENCWSGPSLQRLQPDSGMHEMDLAVDVFKIGALCDLICESYAKVGKAVA